MSKYSIAKELLASAAETAEAANMEAHDVLEAILVTGIQDLIANKGGPYARSFLQYELDSVSADGVFEIQKR